MELETGSKIIKCFIDQGVNWLFLKVWGKTIKVTKSQGAKRKFTLNVVVEFTNVPLKAKEMMEMAGTHGQF
ncbi:hypothetical protein Hanom_Chr05g00464761 [Helianthus anomalus]